MKNNEVPRFFEYYELIEKYYKERDTNSEALTQCVRYCQIVIENSKDFIKVWLAEDRKLGNVNPKFPRIPAFERLAIIYEKQGNYAAAIEVCNRAIDLDLHNPEKCHSPVDFEKRIERLKKKLPDNLDLVSQTPKKSGKTRQLKTENARWDKEQGISVRWIEGRKIKAQSSKSLYEVSDGNHVTIENLALNHYKQLGFQGIWSENDYWTVIMTLLFWDQIFAKLPGLYADVFKDFPNELQDIPLDLFTPEFYPRREKLILSREQELLSAGLLAQKKSDLQDVLLVSHRKNFGRKTRLIDWQRFSREELLLPFGQLTDRQILKITRRLLEDYNNTRRGLPDLFLVSTTSTVFAEVKSEKEKIADHQFEWLQFLKTQIGCNVEICRVAST